MTAYVVDENVQIVANDTDPEDLTTPQANDACKLACIQALQSLRRHMIVVDGAGEVLARYQENLNWHGQPRVGDAFFKYLNEHQYDVNRVLRVDLKKDATRRFEEFPADQALAEFDWEDRIYVALVLMAGEGALILNAVDSDYSQYKVSLEAAGANVYELCPDCI